MKNDKKENQDGKLPIFWGLGSFGCKLLKEIYRQGFDGKYICIDNCDIKDFPSDFIAIKYIHHIKSIWNNGLDIPANRTLPFEITKLINSGSKNFLVSGLGRCTGTYLSVMLDRNLRNKNCYSNFMLSIIPSKLSGVLKREIAISSTTMLPENYYIDLDAKQIYHTLNEEELIMELGNQFTIGINAINKMMN